ncbi:hypothetical protein Agub_g2463 [Astrephomene gubernaculifera]|uniref:Uncharacterized protein n=1 Tax=Astrephomene gubernaculifera TaxID=47775 RepID=A0AAD3DHM1_9CHLO|nr:hypothetical protein Agub_g2463 [Astrephomene gubernaculifera]
MTLTGQDVNSHGAKSPTTEAVRACCKKSACADQLQDGNTAGQMANAKQLPAGVNISTMEVASGKPPLGDRSPGSGPETSQYETPQGNGYNEVQTRQCPGGPEPGRQACAEPNIPSSCDGGSRDREDEQRPDGSGVGPPSCDAGKGACAESSCASDCEDICKRADMPACQGNDSSPGGIFQEAVPDEQLDGAATQQANGPHGTPDQPMSDVTGDKATSNGKSHSRSHSRSRDDRSSRGRSSASPRHAPAPAPDGSSDDPSPGSGRPLKAHKSKTKSKSKSKPKPKSRSRSRSRSGSPGSDLDSKPGSSKRARSSKTACPDGDDGASDPHRGRDRDRRAGHEDSGARSPANRHGDKGRDRSRSRSRSRGDRGRRDRNSRRKSHSRSRSRSHSRSRSSSRSRSRSPSRAQERGRERDGKRDHRDSVRHCASCEKRRRSG